MRKIKIDKNTEITLELIQKIIDNHVVESSRIKKMKEYYNNNNYAIMNRQYNDPNKPQNKLSHGYCSYITDNFVGYLFGKPVTYKSDNTNLIEKLTENFDFNDEVDNNTTLAQEQSIVGYAYELIYTDEMGNIRFKCLDTENTIVVYDNTLEENELLAIRLVVDEEQKGLAYIYRYDDIEALEKSVTLETYIFEKNKISKFVEAEVLVFNQLPICTYENNRQRLGDFEKVITLVDAYDQANSDTANDFEYFTDALLVISGIQMKEIDEQGNEVPLNFKQNRVLNFANTDSKAEYLIKNINDAALENYKNRLSQDIHKFANVVDLSDEAFAGNSSGVSLKFKLNCMENVASIKESKFRKGLMKRIEVITSALNIKMNSEYAYTEIKPVFTRNIPSNDTEIVDIVTKLSGIVSQETLLSILPFVTDVPAEKEAIKNEQSSLYNDNYSELGGDNNV